MADQSTSILGIRDLPDNFSQYENRIHEATVWHLLVMEDVTNEDIHIGQRITGQFTPQNATHSIGANLPEAGGFSRAHPLMQWVGGKMETFSIEVRLFSEHSKDQTAREKIELFKLLVKPMEPLGRPPLMRFFWGDVIPGGMPCFIESLGGIRYDEIRPDGSIRGATLTMSFKRFTPFTIERITTSPVERTPIHHVRTGETYEMIALRHFGDPLLGVALRQQNPRFPMKKWAPRGIADLTAGETIKLYPKRDLDGDRIRPQSHIFNENNRASADLRRYYFMTRAEKTSIIPKR